MPTDSSTDSFVILSRARVEALLAHRVQALHLPSEVCRGMHDFSLDFASLAVPIVELCGVFVGWESFKKRGLSPQCILDVNYYSIPQINKSTNHRSYDQDP